MHLGERTAREAAAVWSARHGLMVASVAVGAAATGWAHFCPERLAAGDTGLVLLAEELVMDEEPGGGTVVGIYQSSSGSTLTVACPSGQPDYDWTGASA